MKQGIYHVSFETSLSGGEERWIGEGLVVVENGNIRGGDASFVYVGNYTDNGDVISLSILIQRVNDILPGALGIGDSLDLKFSGTQDDENRFHFDGEVIGFPQDTISADGKLAYQL